MLRYLHRASKAVCLFGTLISISTPGLAQERTLVPPVIIIETHAPVTRPTTVIHNDGSPSRSMVQDGPMCSTPIQEKYDGPPPTHYGVLVMEPATPEESIEVEHQIKSCSRSVKQVADPFTVLAMMRLEVDLGLPPGLLASGWCWEAAMRLEPRPGDNGQSHGIFQMMSWFWDWCGLPFVNAVTLDFTMATTCYAARIQHYLDDGICPGNYTRAEAMAANAMKYSGWKCKAKSLHGVELDKWRGEK